MNQKAAAKKDPRPEAAKQVAAAAAGGELVAAGTIDFAADAGAGLEGTDKDSFAIPFLAVLQPLSPQIDAVVGAKAGQFLNTVTLELYDRPRIVPCAFQRRWIRWGAREAGGGFKGEFTPAQVNDMRDKKEVVELDGRLYFPDADGAVNPKKNDRLSDTRSHFVLLCTGPDAELGSPAVLALTSTGIKVSKNFLSRIESKKIKTATGFVSAPSFSMVYEAKTEKKTNEKGSWHQPSVEPVSEVTSASLYAQAKAFHAQVTAGRVKVDHDKAPRPDGEADGGGGAEGF